MNTKRPPRRPNVFTPWLRRFTDERAEDLRSTTKLYNRVRDAHRASIWSKHTSLDALIDAILQRIDPAPPEVLRENFRKAVAELLVLETAVFFFPDDTDPSGVISLKEQVDLRRFLRAKEHFLAHDEQAIDMLARVIIAGMEAITRTLPTIESSTRTLTVPLAAHIKDVTGAINHIIANVLDEKVADLGLCVQLHDTIATNICRASGIEPGVESKKPYIFPDEADLPPDRLISAYLTGTPFEALL